VSERRAPTPLSAMSSRPCASLSGARRLHVSSSAISEALVGDRCLHEVLRRFSQAQLGFVVTWSLGSREARDRRRARFGGMKEMSSLYSNREEVAMQVYARGASCSQLTVDLNAWVATGRAACIDGPNLGAREAHTVLRFAEEFYNNLPQSIVFTQDDPEVNFLLRPGPKSAPAAGAVGSVEWAHELQAAFEARRAAAMANVIDPYNETIPWELGPCPCLIDVERGFTPRRYGVYRPMHWWLRSFLHPFASVHSNNVSGNADSSGGRASRGASSSVVLNLPPPFPRKIAWPRHAQFAVPRDAIRLRTRQWWRYNAELTSLPSPIKHLFPRHEQDSDKDYTRKAKCVMPQTCSLFHLPPASANKYCDWLVNGASS